MYMVPVESKAISEIGYDEEDSALGVRFLSGGLHYYDGVPPSVWEQMQKAESLGKFFHSHIRGKYPARKIPEYPSEMPAPPPQEQEQA